MKNYHIPNPNSCPPSSLSPLNSCPPSSLNSCPPSSLAGRGLGGGVSWQSPPEIWSKLKPLARQMRTEPTLAEKQLWQRLKNKQLLGFKFRRQQVIDRFIVDFYCHEVKLVIEVDGEIHNYTQVEDAIREEFLESLGLRVVRFKNEDVLFRIEGVLEEIVQWLKPHP
ncbi:MAG: endonuclease domain-containing protein [Dolichospermum sp.]